MVSESDFGNRNLAQESAQFPDWKNLSSLPPVVRSRPMGLLLAGAALGAAAMYLFDPQRWRARRVQLKDKFVNWAHQFQSFQQKKMSHLRDQFMGWDATVNQFQDSPTIKSKTKPEDHFN